MSDVPVADPVLQLSVLPAKVLVTYIAMSRSSATDTTTWNSTILRVRTPPPNPDE
jgi:hypothetical protein